MKTITPEVERLVGRLRKLIAAVMPEAEEKTYGGAKVTTILYSIGGPAKVVCGIGPGKKDDCLLYLHRISEDDSPVLTLGGKGKHCLHYRVTAGGVPGMDEQSEDAAMRDLLRIARGRLTS
jgi:hypothetical protein